VSEPIDLQYLREAIEAVRDGEPMAEDTYDGLIVAIAEVERLRADLDRALTDGAASHGRYLAADSDYRYQSEKAARHWQERCQAITERDDARLALAMARGEGWPEGWERHGMTWWSPDGQARIYHGERFTAGGTEPTWTLERGSRIVATHHPDALSALRAYQAMVTP